MHVGILLLPLPMLPDSIIAEFGWSAEDDPSIKTDIHRRSSKLETESCDGNIITVMYSNPCLDVNMKQTTQIYRTSIISPLPISSQNILAPLM
ncbi:hypothetical protein F5Y04DRAFT_9740 [Hypomontagnella monticulosa]|nr:hypothetical protein F5Y04DRAFT_9740 [Hypomontagnella monticulosa]